MKICYLLLAHRNFPQVARLLNKLAPSAGGFVVHIDASVDAETAAAFREDIGRYAPVYTPRVSARWGSYDQALAIMQCVQSAAAGPAYDRYCLLSGQDYPIVSPEAITRFFEDNSDAEFVEAFERDVSDPAVPGWSPYYRFRRHHFWLGTHHLTVPLLRKGMPPLPIFHGSTWWALTRRALLYVAKEFRSNHGLRHYLRTGFLVDEVYVPTILKNSPMADNLKGDNVTHARWTPTSGPHPTVLTVDDFEELRLANRLFARKFDADVDSAILDLLDERTTSYRRGDAALRLRR